MCYFENKCEPSRNILLIIFALQMDIILWNFRDHLLLALFAKGLRFSRFSHMANSHEQRATFDEVVETAEIHKSCHHYHYGR